MRMENEGAHPQRHHGMQKHKREYTRFQKSLLLLSWPSFCASFFFFFYFLPFLALFWKWNCHILTFSHFWDLWKHLPLMHILLAFTHNSNIWTGVSSISVSQSCLGREEKFNDPHGPAVSLQRQQGCASSLKEGSYFLLLPCCCAWNALPHLHHFGLDAPPGKAIESQKQPGEAKAIWIKQ